MNRRSGRTLLMLREAMRLEQEGHAVYVVAANENHRKRLRSQLPMNTSIKVETPHSIGGIHEGGRFNWYTMRGLGMHPNCRVLIDHHAIEQGYAQVLKELHRYDEGVR